MEFIDINAHSYYSLAPDLGLVIPLAENSIVNSQKNPYSMTFSITGITIQIRHKFHFVTYEEQNLIELVI